jgi:hypothetical protein
MTAYCRNTCVSASGIDLLLGGVLGEKLSAIKIFVVVSRFSEGSYYPVHRS